MHFSQQFERNQAERTQEIKNQCEDTQTSPKSNKHPSTFKSSDFQLCDIIGNWQKGILIVHLQGYLYAVDIHAASQKILFEKQLANPAIIKSRKVEKTFYVPRYYLQTLKQRKEVIATKGWNFHIKTVQACQIQILIKASPYFYGEEATQSQFENLLKSQYYQEQYEHTQLQLTRMATYSCKNSPKVGDLLSYQELRKMLRDLGQINASFNCPHGRPTIFSIGKASSLNPFQKQKKYQL